MIEMEIEMDQRYRTAEDLLEKPYWVVDLLPEQVPADSPGHFFEVERFYLKRKRQRALHRKYLGILLKLNCYFDMHICGFAGVFEGGWEINPKPKRLEQLLEGLSASQYDKERVTTVDILFASENALIVLNHDDICMTVYNPSENLLRMLKLLSAAEGLFIWQPLVQK